MRHKIFIVRAFVSILIGGGIPLIQPRHRSICLKLLATKAFPRRRRPPPLPHHAFFLNLRRLIAVLAAQPSGCAVLTRVNGVLAPDACSPEIIA